MYKNRFILLLFLSFIFQQGLQAQDFFGAGFTGKYNYGVNVKYDGSLWAGVNFNFQNFGNLGSRPWHYNAVISTRLNDGIDKVRGDFGLAQIYSNNGNEADFGLATRYGLQLDYCPVPKSSTPTNTSLSLNISLKPGLFDVGSTVTGNINIRPLQYSFGCGSLTGAGTDATPSLTYPITSKIGLGVHYDYTNAANLSSNGRYHFSADALYNINLDLDSDTECDPDEGLSIQMSHNMRF